MQFELDFGYHIAAIDIFLKALGMARANGYEGEFPASYIETVGKMTAVTWNLLFPDWSNPMFGDTKSHDKSSLQRQFRSWSKVFPGDKQLQWFATEGRKGALPDYTSQQFPESGFYVLRTGWDKNATVTVVKAGPPGVLAQPARQRARSSTGAGGATSSPTRAATSTAATAPCWPNATGSARPACTTP